MRESILKCGRRSGRTKQRALSFPNHEMRARHAATFTHICNVAMLQHCKWGVDDVCVETHNQTQYKNYASVAVATET